MGMWQHQTSTVFLTAKTRASAVEEGLRNCPHHATSHANRINRAPQASYHTNVMDNGAAGVTAMSDPRP